MSPHDPTTDATRCYPLTGRHLQDDAILGHQTHGGRVRLTVTQARQIGELVAWGQNLDSDSGRPRVPRIDADPSVGTRRPPEGSWGDSGRFEESA